MIFYRKQTKQEIVTVHYINKTDKVNNVLNYVLSLVQIYKRKVENMHLIQE